METELSGDGTETRQVPSSCDSKVNVENSVSLSQEKRNDNLKTPVKTQSIAMKPNVQSNVVVSNIRLGDSSKTLTKLKNTEIRSATTPTYKISESSFSIIRPKSSETIFTRRSSHAVEFEQEMKWFGEPVFKPANLPNIEDLHVTISSFATILWNNPSDLVLSEFGLTADHMAQLCCDRGLNSSHMSWIADKMNQDFVKNHSICVCVDGSKPEEILARLFKSINVPDIQQVIFLFQVTKSKEGEVCITTSTSDQTHWTLLLVRFRMTIEMTYCDSLAWALPTNLSDYLTPYLKCMGISDLQMNIAVAHKPSGEDSSHVCNEVDCKNFPYQRSLGFSGVLMTALTVVACYDLKLMTLLLDKYYPKDLIYLHRTDLYGKYMRIVMLYWFAKGVEPSVFSLQDKDYPSDFNFQPDSLATEDNKMPVTPVNMIAQEEYIDAESKKKNKKVYFCPFCKMQLSSRNSVYKHKKRKHPDEKPRDPPVTCMKCGEFKCATIGELVSHLNMEHLEGLTIENLTFANEAEFSEWKMVLEQSTGTYYVKPNGPKLSPEGKVQWYKCNRSGSYESVSQRKRAPRAKGTCKIGGICCSYMKAVHTPSGEVNVECCLKHTFHNREADLAKMLVGMLEQQGNISSILDEVRNRFEGNLIREKLVKKEDVETLRQSFNIDTIKRHKSDPTSVDLWVEGLQKQSYNPVVIYKRQDARREGIAEEDFLLGIQTEFQCNSFLAHGRNTVCIGAIKKATAQNFHLITVVVIDNFGDAVPVAWLISSKDSEQILTLFLQSLHLRCGNISVQTFVSDVSTSYRNSWTNVFGEPVRHLYCSWHLDQEWRRLLEKIKEDRLKVDVYHAFKSLQYESDAQSFSKLSSELASWLGNTNQEVLKNFQEKFINHPHLWASCCQGLSNVHFNIFLEDFQRTLRYVYFNRKRNRRVDFLLSILVKIAEDKVLEQIAKGQSLRPEDKMKEIREHHEQAAEINDIEEVESDCVNKSWIVLSPDESNDKQTVKRTNSQCPPSCVLRCEQCNLCIHHYTCTCTDFVLHSVPCKHMHAVQKKFGTDDIILQELPNTQLVTHEASSSNIVEEISTMRSKIFEDVTKLAEMVKDTASLDRLKTVQHILSTAVIAGETMTQYAENDHDYVIFIPGSAEFEEIVQTEPLDEPTAKRKADEAEIAADELNKRLR